MAPKAPKIDIPANSDASDFVVSITSPAHRRRAGISFGPTPEHLTRAQIEAKLADGRTVIEAISEDPLLVIRPYKPEPQADVQAEAPAGAPQE